MPTIDHLLLLSATTSGGPSALSSITPLEPAGGPQSVVAPAKYVTARQSDQTYVYDTRFIDGEPQRTVLLDSSQSQTNRIEQALDAAIGDGDTVLGRLPRIRVTYERDGVVEQYTDLTLPHRAFDAHIRAGSIDGAPTTDHDLYRAARDANPLDASGLLNVSPISLVFGSWDASRKARQGRWPSALTGEVIGVLADQRAEATTSPLKGGARVDPVGMRAQVDGPTLLAMAEAQKRELSAKTYDDLVRVAKKLKPGETTSAAALGFGGIPPTLAQLGGVSCRQITRASVLSFATLRQIRFGAGARGDAACRAVLAALAINGLVRSNAELYLRAGCHLVEAGETTTRIDRRNGQHEDLTLPSIDESDALLAEALDDAAQHAGLDWHGQILEVVGNPAITAGREDEPAGAE